MPATFTRRHFQVWLTARLTTLDKARSNIVNLDQLGGQADALAAYHRSIRAAGGRLEEIGRNDRGNPTWTSSDGVTYEFYNSPTNADTVIAIVPSQRAPTRGEWELKVRFRTRRSDEGQTK